MSQSFKALSVNVDEDLRPLSVTLFQRGVRHRIYESHGQQVLMVADEAQVDEVVHLYRAWRAGELRIELEPRQPPAPRAGVTELARQAPVTLLLILLSVAGFLLVYLNAPLALLSLFTFTPFTLSAGQVLFEPQGSEYWRLLTPAFLHFGWLHIVFNSLWMWELGAKVERALGSLNMLGLFVVIAIVSNSAQYLFGGPAIFGGMSGVVYGLLGFAWLAGQLQPAWQIQPRAGIMLFMVGWLLICVLGVVEVLGFGAIANAAHIGGLLSGAVLGAAFGTLSRLSGDN